jgi:polar amino acid transport system substrate-binding protein
MSNRVPESSVWVAAAVFLLAMSSASAAGRPVLVINDTNGPPFTTADHSGFLDRVAGEAFRRAGVDLKLVKLPAERALLDANAGIGDGDLTRIAGIEQQYPNLVRVPEKLVDWEFSAFSRNASIVSNWDAIRQRSSGHIKGWKIYEQQMAGASQVLTAEEPEQLFRLLERGRIEVALYMRWMGLALLNEKGVRDIHALDPPLAKREMFIYLNKRHADLAPKIAVALKAIKSEGLYDRWYREKVLIYADKPVK